MIALHMGALHPYEQALTFLLAFGPFVGLALVVWLRRREDDAAETASTDASSDASAGLESAREPERVEEP